jgi:Uncharacterized protein conserved in bacteria (DUF2184)
MIREHTILNSKGEPILLNEKEQRIANVCQKKVNSLGYEVSITTLTTIMKKISEQKFFEIPPADYLPVRVGEGAWSSNLVTYRSFSQGDEFETGVLNMGGQNTRLASADAGVDSLTIQVNNWAKMIGWSIMELEIAAKSGNWDLVTARERARKKNWDLGIQRVAFLGSRGNQTLGNILGLLNQPSVSVNTTLITAPISSLTPDQLKAFVAGIVEAYRSNCNRSAYPTHFVIPESDYNGLASQASSTFPIKSTLELLEESFKLITRNAGFKIIPLAYADKAYSGYTKQVYTLLNYDEESLRMDIPVDYTNTIANSLDNFMFQNVGYGQFTGVLAYRPLEMLYFQF